MKKSKDKILFDKIEKDLREGNADQYLKNHHDLRRAYLKLDKRYKRAGGAKTISLIGNIALLPIGVALSLINPVLGYATVAAQVGTLAAYAKSLHTYNYCEEQVERALNLADNSMSTLKYQGMANQYWKEYHEEEEAEL